MSASAAKPNSRKAAFCAALLFLSVLVPATISQEAKAVTSGIELGAASSFAVLAGTGITHAGASNASGSNGADFGSYTLASFTGSETLTTDGTKYVGVDAATSEAQAALAGAKTALQSAYNEAFGRTVNYVLPTLVIGDQTLTPGVYNSGSSIQITGTLTLDAATDADAVFIFQAGSTVITAVNSKIRLINGAQACNVFWQVGSSATVGGGSDFSGSILAHTSITAENGAVINGRLLAINGAVTLVSNTFVNDSCAGTSTSSSPRLVTATRGQAKTTVSWSAPSTNGESAITGYTASAYTLSTGGSAAGTCTTTNLTCEITGLANGTTYYVGVIAANGVGNSDESSPRVTTVPAAAPGAPSVSSVTVGNQFLSIAFSPGSADANAPITRYQYSIDNGTNWLDSSDMASPLLITGLTNGTSYVVKIRAQSDIGAGAASNSSTNSPISLPGEVDPETINYVSGSGSVQVSWTAANTNGAALISTVVTAFGAELGGSAVSSCTANTTATSCVLSTLTTGTNYYVSIQSQNSQGYSEGSNPRVLVRPGNASTATLTMSTSSAQTGASVSLTAAVTAGATGTINFTTDGVSIAGCSAVVVSSNQAVCTTTGLAAKTHAIRANYSGDGTYGSSASLSSDLAILATFALTYNANGGVGAIASATFTTGGTELVLPTPTKTSLTLDGWYASSSLTTKIGAGGDNYTPSGTGTLYAKWVQTSSTTGTGTGSGSGSGSGGGSGSGSGGGGSAVPVVDQEEKELGKVVDLTDREFKPVAPSKPVRGTGVIATENGDDAQPVVAINETNEKVVVKGTGWELTIGAAKKDGTLRTLASDYAIYAMDGEKVVISGSGMAPNTWVDLYVFSDPVFVGTVETDAQGGFNADFDIPSGLSIGAHTLVLGTKNQAGEEVTVTMGLLVLASVVSSEKVNAGSFLGYVAVYALGHKGSTISWKIAGEWYKTKVTSRYQVFQRRTIDLGVDVKVDIYITAAGGDPVRKLSGLVRTR